MKKSGINIRIIILPVVLIIIGVFIGLFTTCTNPLQEKILADVATHYPEIIVKQNINELLNGVGSYDFGSVQVGHTKAVEFIIENNGAGDLKLTGNPLVVTTGGDISEFGLTTMPATTISGGSTTQFTVTFQPSSSGLKTVTVSIATNDPDAAVYTFSLTGTGSAIPVPDIYIEETAGSVFIPDGGNSTFTETDYGAYTDISYTIRNNGTANLDLTGTPRVDIGGADASAFTVLSQQPSTPIAAAGSTAFTIRFQPSGPGVFNGTVTIVNNDADTPSYDFSLSGTAIIELIETKIGNGSYHSTAKKNDGTVWSWGYNLSGQLGDGTQVNKPIPVQASSLSDVAAITSGGAHIVALKTDGTVWAWGYNYYGVVGDNSTTDRYTPTPAQTSGGLTDVSAIAAGSSHTVALKEDGTVWAWGRGYYGALGWGSWNQRNQPTYISGVTNVYAIAAGANNTAALKSDNTVWIWGDNTYGQLGDNTTDDQNVPIQIPGLSDVTAIACGYHTVILKTDKTVWAWGLNDYGQLGDNNTGQSFVPVQASGLSNVDAIATGHNHTVALEGDGTVWVWGRNEYGQLGDGSTTDRHIPTQITGLTNVVAISAGTYHTTVLKNDGTIWTWGRNNYGQLSDGSTTDRDTPEHAAGLPGVIDIQAGYLHSTTHLSDGTVWNWGYNQYRQLGDGTQTQRERPVQASGLSNVTSIISTGSDSNHSLALKNDGSVWAWGRNSSGQLGDGTKTARSTPVQLLGLTDTVSLVTSSFFSAAIKSNGTAWAWGSNSFGQLGDNSTTERLSPTQVKDTPGTSFISGIDEVAAGYFFTAAREGGDLWAWGRNDYGQLGDNTTNNRLTPVRVKDTPGTGYITSISVIRAGYHHTVALMSNGTVWTWGRNSYGQLGDNTSTNRSTPVQVRDTAGTGYLTGISAIAAGSDHTLALDSSGNLWIWGKNDYGQLGDNSTINRDTPWQVLTDVSAIAGGHYHSVVVKTNGSIWAWGYNGHGQFGNDSTTDSLIPVPGGLKWFDID